MLLIANRLLPGRLHLHSDDRAVDAWDIPPIRAALDAASVGSHPWVRQPPQPPRRARSMTDSHQGPFRIQDDDRRQARRRRGRHVHQLNPATEESSARSPTRRRPTCTAPSTRPGGRSTRPTGRPTRASRNGACCSCRRRWKPSRRISARSSSSRSGARGRSPTVRSSTRRSADALSYPAKLIDEYPWETDPRRRVGVPHRA